jgi:diketogulonate reductase-like aldo/keto reductase
MTLVFLSVSVAASAAMAQAPPTPKPYVELGSPLIQMPAINLGTCCGSDPTVGLPVWLQMGGIGIDTAYDYHDQDNISAVLQAAREGTGGVDRGNLFILSKVSPDGYSTMANKKNIRGSDALCKLGAAGALGQLKEDLKELNTTYVDIVLLHWPCGKHTNTDMTPEKLAQNSELWAGLMEAKRMGRTRAIGVSSYNASHLEALKGEKPVLNQCSMSVKNHDDPTIEYCLQNNITYLLRQIIGSLEH